MKADSLPSNKDKTLNSITFLSFVLSISLIAAIFIFLMVNSFPIFRHEGLRFLTGTSWHPVEGYCALPMIFGTVVVTFIAVCISLPLGLGSAIITSETLTGCLRGFTKTAIELLAGVPGVIYGILGVFIVAPAIKQAFGLIDGSSILTAGIILSIMILPTMMTLSDDTLRSIPKKYREQAVTLGFNRRETIMYVVLPMAKKGIMVAVLLSLSRAMATTVAVMMVIGSLDKIPKPLYNILAPAQTITSKLGREVADTAGVGLHWNALAGLGLILFIMVIVMTLIADVMINTSQENKSSA